MRNDLVIYVLDACAIIAYARAETGAHVVAGMIANSANVCMIHSINLCEVYYNTIRTSGVENARSVVAAIGQIGVQTRGDMDAPFWQEAGAYKVAGQISLPDCFAMALTRRLGGELVTCDHREFDPIAQQGICPITFFR